MADQQPPEFSEVLALLSVAVDLAKERDEYQQIGHELDTVAAQLIRQLDEVVAENNRLRVIERAALKLLFDNGGPTGGDTYFGIPDEFVLAKIEDFQALEAAVKGEDKRS